METYPQYNNSIAPATSEPAQVQKLWDHAEAQRQQIIQKYGMVGAGADMAPPVAVASAVGSAGGGIEGVKTHTTEGASVDNPAAGSATAL